MCEIVVIVIMILFIITIGAIVIIDMTDILLLYVWDT